MAISVPTDKFRPVGQVCRLRVGGQVGANASVSLKPLNPSRFLCHNLQAEFLLWEAFITAFKASIHIVEGSLLIWSQLIENVNPIFKMPLQCHQDLGMIKQPVNIV